MLHGCSSRVFVVCGVGSGFCDEMINRSEESYCVCVCVCVCVCGLETSTMRRPRPEFGNCGTEKGRTIYGSYTHYITTSN
jgi:hypothetical protein